MKIEKFRWNIVVLAIVGLMLVLTLAVVSQAKEIRDLKAQVSEIDQHVCCIGGAIDCLNQRVSDLEVGTQYNYDIIIDLYKIVEDSK